MSCYLFQKYCRVWNSSSSIIQTKKLSLFFIFAFLLHDTLLFGVFLKQNQCFPITDPLLADSTSTFGLTDQSSHFLFMLVNSQVYTIFFSCVIFFLFPSHDFTVHTLVIFIWSILFLFLLLIPFLTSFPFFIPLRYVMIHDFTSFIIPYTCSANASHLSQQYLLLLLLFLLLFIFDYSLHGSPCIWIS